MLHALSPKRVQSTAGLSKATVESRLHRVIPPLNRAFLSRIAASNFGHQGPGMYWMTRGLDKEENAPQCYFDLNSVSFTTRDTNIQAYPTPIISHFGPQCPQDYGEGFLFDCTVKKWEEWRKCFQHQTGTVLLSKNQLTTKF